MNIMWLARLPEAAQAVAGVILALYALASALSLAFGILGAFWPPALAAAKCCSDIGLRLHNAGTWLGGIVRGSLPPPPALAIALAIGLGAPMAATVTGCASLTALWKKDAPILKRDLALDEKDLPCILAHAPDVAAALTECNLAEDLRDLIVDLYNGKSVQLASGASIRVLMPVRDGGSDAH